MIKFSSLRLGELEVPEDKVVEMATHFLGFPESHRYAILDDKRDARFKWLQSLDEPSVSLPAVDPRVFFPDYRIFVKEDELTNLGVARVADLKVFVILTLGPKAGEMTANLQGPVLINPTKRIGRQLVLKDSKYSLKQPIFGEKQA